MVKNPSPFKGDGFAHIPVPCGKCYDCKMRTASQWALRLRKEEDISISSHFVTLTYDTEYVPISSKGYMTLRLADVQKYFKRIRKNLDPATRIRYFVCGEYGTQRDRPHYHLILFNCPVEYITSCWNLGNVHIGNVSGQSIAYTLKYMMKEGKIPKHKNDDRKPEFRTMSKGLGQNYLTPAMVEFHKTHIDRLFATIEGGIRVPLPRYYRERIWNESERQEQNLILQLKLKEHQNNDKQTIEERQRGAEVRNKRAFKNARNRGVD
ncbi:MAG: replication initiator protein [Wigfec virus K19_165]|nr:MAG: replication initiator protein [Wigfec virus K19_165]